MKCEVCEKQFSTRGNLKRHMNTVHSSRRYSCSQCIKSFNRKDYLKVHNSLVHEKEKVDKTSYPVVCKKCGKRYKSKRALSYHIDSHHNPEVHYCTLCIKRFSTKLELKRHMERNHDNFEYEERLLKGKKLLEFLVEECVPVDIMPKEDMKLINLYRRYIYQKVYTWLGDLVPL